MTFLGILENIISDLLTILLLFIFGWIIIFLTKRYKLQRFFKVSNSRRLVLYLSNLRVRTFGSVGLTGQKLSYQGEAVPYGEVEAANKLSNLFSFPAPNLSDTFRFIGKLFLSDVSVQITISPTSENTIDSEASIVSLGSSAYNSASKHIESLENNCIKFVTGLMSLDEIDDSVFPVPPSGVMSDTDQSIQETQRYTGGTLSVSSLPNTNIHYPKVDNFPTRGESRVEIEGLDPITDTTKGFVERIIAEDRSFFYIAGLSEHATRGAANYLFSEWKYLFKKYKANKSFLISLQIDSFDFTKYSILFEKEII